MLCMSEVGKKMEGKLSIKLLLFLLIYRASLFLSHYIFIINNKFIIYYNSVSSFFFFEENRE